MHFTELDSYDICGLSAMISRTVPHHRSRYILRAMGAACLQQSRQGDEPFSSWDYVFIKNDESLRTGPL